MSGQTRLYRTHQRLAPHAARIRCAIPTDAFALAALTIQADREFGASPPPGFLNSFADAWLADRARVTWIAETADHRPVGMVHASVIRKLPSATRAVSCWLNVGLLFVSVDHRGHGLGEALMRTLLEWARHNNVTRVRLNAEAKARPLYERIGFSAPGPRAMEIAIPAGGHSVGPRS